MSQNLINDLSDRVSALTATLNAERRYADAEARKGRVMAEWLNAIRLEIEARGSSANIETCLHSAQEALSGREPHWLTSEYLNKTRDPRAHYQERFRNAD
jgi:hypothetical protein